MSVGFCNWSRDNREIIQDIGAGISRQYKTVEIANNSSLEQIQSENIEYICAEDVYVEFHMINSNKILVRTSLNEMEKELTDCGFFRIHRKYLVNMRYIIKIKKNDIVINSGELPVAVRRQNEFKKTYAEFCKRGKLYMKF